MTTITVVGAGMMGSALCVPLADRHHDVRLVGTHLDGAIVEQLRIDHVHPTLGVPLPATIQPFPLAELPAAMEGTDIIALGVSSAGVSWAIEQLAPYARPGRPIFMITKGLQWDGERLRALPDIVGEGLGGEIHPAAIAGPCIAGELARRVPSCVVLAGRDDDTLGLLADALRTDYYHLWTSADVAGVEICAALKNAYAMAVALGAGLHERRGGQPGSVAMHNVESAVFAQAIREMRLVAQLVGGDPDSATWLPGVGDLDVTNNGGRTGRFGRFLGRGLSLDDAIAAMQGATLECLEIIGVMREAMARYAERGELSPSGALPLLEHLVAVVCEGERVDLPFAHFFGPDLAVGASSRGGP